MVEPSFFGRALDNLVANSLQYAPPKSQVKIECVARRDRGVRAGRRRRARSRRASTASRCSPGRDSPSPSKSSRPDTGAGIGLFCASQAARVAGAEVTLSDRAGCSLLEISAPLAP